MPTVDHAALVERLSELAGAAILGLTTRTDARLRKRGHNLGRVDKVARVTALVNFHYDRAVRRRLAAAGQPPESFTPRRSWHLAVLDGGRLTPFCRHKETGELYLRALVLSRVGRPVYVAADGTPLSPDAVDPWLPRPAANAHQGLDDPVEFRVYKMASILEVTFGGRTYTVRADR